MEGKFLCTNCGYQGQSIMITKGSFLVEIVLWLLFILPGFIYTMWRFLGKYEGCPECLKDTLIPINSPKAQRILSAK